MLYLTRISLGSITEQLMPRQSTNFGSDNWSFPRAALVVDNVQEWI